MQGILDQFDPLSISKQKANKDENNTAAQPAAAAAASTTTTAEQPTKPEASTSSSSTSTSQKSSESDSKKTPSTTPAEPVQIDEKKSSLEAVRRIEPNSPPPFDFQWFLDLLRHKSADPIARYLKSFLTEFNKRNWTADEQIKIITDFKNFIADKMTQYPPFSNLSEPEMANALEGMEKLVMNRLYSKTFSPEIPDLRRIDSHEEDVLRDRILDDKMSIWQWIEGRHLDIPNKFLRNGESFVKLASDELRKINHYRAPRDKVVCILNCCKVIFGLLRQTSREENADGFVPLLIYVVIKAHPKNLVSNINYIQRFRNPDKLFGEAGYYLSSLQGAVSFIETLDLTSLSITEEEFNRNMDAAELAKKKAQSVRSESTHPPSTPERSATPDPSSRRLDSPRAQSGNLTPSAVLQNSAGLLAVPFKSFTKFFDAEPSSPPTKPATPAIEGTIIQPDQETLQDSSRKLHEAAAHEKQMLQQQRAGDFFTPPPDASNSRLSPEELAARQVSAEEEEARRISRKEFKSVVNTLSQMFPALDRNIIVDVATETQGRVGAAVDACLSLVTE